MRRELETQLEAAPHDAAAFLVYADFLLSEGDPLGELIRLQHALTQKPGDPQLLARDLELREQLAPALHRFGARWELGFPRLLKLIWLNDEVLAQVGEALSSPLSRFIESIRLSDLSRHHELTALAKLIVMMPHLDALELTNNLELLGGSHALSSLLAQLTPKLPGLRHLTLEMKSCRELLSEMPKLALSRLTVRGATLEAGDAQAFKLARLAVGRGCALRLEHASCSFEAEAAIAAEWPFELEGPRGSGLLVESPAAHRGRWLSSGSIGGHFSCELQLAEIGPEHFVLLGNSLGGRLLEDGEAVRLGNVTLRFHAALAAAREHLKDKERLPR